MTVLKIGVFELNRMRWIDRRITSEYRENNTKAVLSIRSRGTFVLYLLCAMHLFGVELGDVIAVWGKGLGFLKSKGVFTQTLRSKNNLWTHLNQSVNDGIMVIVRWLFLMNRLNRILDFVVFWWELLDVEKLPCKQEICRSSVWLWSCSSYFL